MHTVPAPGGQASVIDLRKEAGPEEIDAEVRHMSLSPVRRGGVHVVRDRLAHLVTHCDGASSPWQKSLNSVFRH